MKLASLFSGGKDSVYAAYLAKKLGHKIEVLVSIKSENPESYMFHVPNIDLVKLQAEAMNIPLIFKKTKGEKELELEDLKQALIEAKNKFKIEGVVSGAIFSKYQKQRIDKICSELGLKSIAPLWKKLPREQWKEMLGLGFKIIMVLVAAQGLEKDWLGKQINQKEFEQLLSLHNTCYVCTGAEGGEFETFVTDCPLFKKKIQILKSETSWDEKTGSGEFIIKDAKLVGKL